MSRRASYRQGAAFGLLSFASMAVLGVASGIVVARIYGIETVGAYALAFAPVGICGALSSLQEQAGLVRELATLPAKAPRITGLFAPVLAFSAVLTGVIALAVGAIAYVLFAGPIDRPDLFAPAGVLLAEYMLVTNTSWNLDMVFASFQAGRELYWIRLLHGLVFLAMAVGFGLASDSVWALVAAQVAAALVSFAVRVVVVRRFMALVVPSEEIRAGMSLFPQIVKFGAKVAPGFVAGGVSNESGTWILGLTVPVAAVGAWNRVWLLGSRLMDPTHRVAEMLLPALVARRAAGDHQGFDRALADSARYLATGLLLLAAAAGGAAYGVMDLYGEGFSRGADALTLVLLVPVAYCISTLNGQALIAVDRPLVTSMISVVRTVLIIALGAVLAVAIGVTGMALAMLAGWIVDVAWKTLAVRRHIKTPLASLLPPRVAAAPVLAYGAGLGVSRLADSAVGGVPGLLLALTAGGAAFVGTFLLVGGVVERDRERLGALGRRLRGRVAVAVEPTRT